MILLALLCLATTTTTATALVLPPPLPSATSINLNINAPAVIESVKTKEGRAAALEKVNFFTQTAKFMVGPDNVSVDRPTDLKGFVKQALQGQASVTVNTGLEQMPKQQLDFQVVSSDWGAVTVQIRNPLLPKLPLLLPKETPEFISNAVSDTVVAVGSVVERVHGEVGEGATPPSPPFWSRPIRDGTVVLYNHAITPLDIVGSSLLTLGVVYGKSYQYYLEQQELEEKEAEARKKAAAAKRAQKNKAESAAAPSPSKKKKPANKDKPAFSKGKTDEKPKESTEPSGPVKVIAKAASKESTSPTETATKAPLAVTVPSGSLQLQRSVTSIALPQEKKPSNEDSEGKDGVPPTKPMTEKKKRSRLLRLLSVFLFFGKK